ncbi:MAG: HAD hydrolase family protein [Candidatus Marinimicrobia bacterium]|nr:HAD hydrolase family protein [Candidatus Neomarinimicrobiota bacterium]
MNEESHAALKKIKVILTDVDGVMTDGGIVLGTDGREFKRYDVKDGMGVTMARSAGLKVCIITGRSSESVSLRAEELKIDKIYQGSSDKVKAYTEIKSEYDLEDENFLHVGDDLLDLPLFDLVGFSAAPADGIKLVKEKADYIASAKGGHGVLREVIDLVLTAQDKLDEVVKKFGTVSETGG